MHCHLHWLLSSYGEWAWRGLLAYALGWVAIVPFAVLPGFWTGPLANKIGGVDIGWLMGLLISGGSYFILAKGINVAAEAPVVVRSQYELG
jgi:NCS1 family nucleobase:cation symporter-1